MRFQWPVPPEEELKAHIRLSRRASLKECLERYKFICREFGPPMNVGVLLMGGFLSIFALQELPICYIDGHYMACILLAQVFIEDSLGNYYIILGEDNVAKQKFEKLINQTHQDNVISAELKEQFHRLRSVRNRYVHPRSGDGKETLIAHFVKKASQDIGTESDRDLLKDDAEMAIQTVVDFLRETTQYDEDTQQMIDYLSKQDEDKN